jgi:type I restriction enzyme S subunit
MEEWKEYIVCDLGRIVTGKTPRTSIPENYGGKIPFLTPSDDLSGKYSPKTIKTITDTGLKEVKNCLLPSKSICVSCIGSDLGKVVITKEPTVTNQQFNSIIPNDKNDADYIYYLMTIVGKQLNYLSKTSTAVPIVNKSTFSSFRVKLPLKKVQHCIASILSSLDDKIEVNRKINENLEQQAQALFKSWFVDFEPFRDGEFVESELGMIPKGWRVGCLDELCSFISRGLTPKYDETSEELILGQTCVRNNIVTLNNARKHRPKTKNEKWVQQWDVLLNSTGVGSLGRVGIVYFNMDNVAIDSHITVVRASNPIYRHYVGRNLLSRQLEIENMAVGSTGQTELPRDRVKTMPIIIPSHNSMIKFNYIIEPMAISMYNNIIESRRLAELRDTLLPKLMSGELKVNDIH